MQRERRRIVVVGGGLAGLRSAEALRKLRYEGSLTLLSGESTAPYDRPPLSKGVLTGTHDPQDTIFRADAHFDELAIDLVTGVAATGLDLDRRLVRTDDGELAFDGLILATGSAPRRLPVGVAADGARVHVVRNLQDAIDLREALQGASRVVVIGGGFIGSEVASSARHLGLDVTIVSSHVPLAKSVGDELGEICGNLHRAHGTRLINHATITSVHGDADGSRITLADGRVIHGDVVVAGVGGVPHLEWLNGSGLPVGDGLLCDRFLNAGHPDVYAAGDIVRWPNALDGTSMRSEQWTSAVDQARTAAHNLLGTEADQRPFGGSNYFWSDQYGGRIQFAGTKNAEEVRIVSGDQSDFEFVALYRKDDRLAGVFGMNQPGPFVRSKILLEQGASWDAALSAAADSGLSV